jgi:hypothetical protein
MDLAVWTDDVDAAYASLVAAGVPVDQPPRDAGNNNNNNNRHALLRDPDEKIAPA